MKQIGKISLIKRIKEKLIMKQKIKVIDLKDDYAENEPFDNDNVRKALVEKLGLLKEYKNNKLNFSFEFSKTKFKESLYQSKKRKKPLNIQKKLLFVFDEVVYNAVIIEKHNDIYLGTLRADKTLDKVYIMLSAFQDFKNVYPVELIVKQFYDKNGSLHMAVVIGEIKKTGLTPIGIHPDNIIVKDIIEYVNDGEFLKYVPDSFLSSKQLIIKQEAISKEKNKIKKLKIYKRYSM